MLSLGSVILSSRHYIVTSFCHFVITPSNCHVIELHVLTLLCTETRSFIHECHRFSSFRTLHSSNAFPPFSHRNFSTFSIVLPLCLILRLFVLHLCFFLCLLFYLSSLLRSPLVLSFIARLHVLVSSSASSFSLHPSQ